MARLADVWRRYFNSRWLPGALFLFFYGGFAVVTVAHARVLAPAVLGLFAASLLSLLCILPAALWNLVRKRWANGLFNLLSFALCVCVAVAGFILLLPLLFFGPSEDGFADRLSLPEGVALAEPEPELVPGFGAGVGQTGEVDGYQAALLAALDAPGGDDPTVTGSIESLARLHREHPDLLMRHLATSCAWRVFEENGARFATRRWRIGGQWTPNLHGYYGGHDLDMWDESGIRSFQTRLAIGLSGVPSVSAPKGSAASRAAVSLVLRAMGAGKGGKNGEDGITWIEAGETKKAALSFKMRHPDSLCIVKSEGLTVEIFERTDVAERRLTRAALAQMEAEFSAVAENPAWETARAALPAESARKGGPFLSLRKSFQPGIYVSVLRVNPGEPGMVYLKAFEMTKGTPLSEKTLRGDTNEWVGWSDDPEETFLSTAQITISEGDWGRPYGARFEVWFVPDNGGPERKLLEKAYKIEGWQR